MQRLLPLVTLSVLGGLGWFFLKGGGLQNIAVTRQQAGQQAPASTNGGTQSPGLWSQPNASTSAGFPPSSNTQQSPSTEQPQVQTASVGRGAPSAAGGTIRIASYNIQVFGNTKAEKPAVIRTLAAIVQQFDIVAIQEIRSKNEYLIPNFVKLINQSSASGQPGRHYEHIIGPRLGYTSVKEQYAFIYNTQRVEVDQQSVYTVRDPDGLMHREPLVATFRVRGVDPNEAFTFTLVNVHTDPDQVPEEMDAMAEVYRVVRRSSQGEDDIILLGDFNTDDRRLYRLGKIPGIYPLVIGTWTNTRQNKQYDNLIIHRPSTTEYTGRSGVFDVVRYWNLNMQQALQISDHFPVWAEFSVYERDYAGRIASRQRVRR